jgi:hypothetical protein
MSKDLDLKDIKLIEEEICEDFEIESLDELDEDLSDYFAGLSPSNIRARRVRNNLYKLSDHYKGTDPNKSRKYYSRAQSIFVREIAATVFL